MTTPERGEFRIELEPELQAAGVARRFVADHSDHLPSELVEDAELLVSELVSNAVRHGRPSIVLQVNLEPPLIGVAVSDEGESLPRPPDHEPATDATGGRGLLIVERMSSSWGVTPTDAAPGKTVWFELVAATVDDGTHA